MPNRRQSDRSNPLHISSFFARYGRHTAKRGDLGIRSRPFPPVLLNIQAIRSNKERIWFVQDHLIPFKTIAFGVLLCIFSPFWRHFKCPQAKQVQTRPNSNFHIPLCLLCLLCTRMSKLDRVLKTHSNRDNSSNNIGRQVQFTSEVTPIGPHIVFKLQPNPTIID